MISIEIIHVYFIFSDSKYIALVPAARELINNFYHSKYKEALNNLAELTPFLLLDMHFQPHFNTLKGLVINACLLQYCTAYSVVDLKKMSSTFNMEVGSNLISLLSFVVSQCIMILLSLL